jgi:hypothetical protein
MSDQANGPGIEKGEKLPDLPDPELHPVCRIPENKEIKIWRYMDLAQLSRTLQTSELFFSRADRLGDPYEASYPLGNQLLNAALLKQHATDRENSPYKDLTPESLQHILSFSAKRLPQLFSDHIVNCWHMNERESAGMWTIHGQSNEAVAIQSTYSRLRKQLHPAILMSEVKYVDYETAVIPVDNIYWPLVHKRIFFEFERELRAFGTATPGLEKRSVAMTRYEGGIGFKIALPELVETIYVSPTAPGWFYETVAAVTKQFNVGVPVAQSAMNRIPPF